MAKQLQNVIYLIVIAIVLATCWYLVKSDTPKNEPHGVFLPKHNIQLPAINPDYVKTYNLSHIERNKYISGIEEDNIGIIRVSKHIDNYNDFKQACLDNIDKAKEIAAAHGANEIWYLDCSNPQGELNALSSVNFQAYAFRK